MGPFERCFHEGYLCRGHMVVISFILTKQFFVDLIRHGDRFYNQYINTKIRSKYLYDHVMSVKLSHFSQNHTHE